MTLDTKFRSDFVQGNAVNINICPVLGVDKQPNYLKQVSKTVGALA